MINPELHLTGDQAVRLASLMDDERWAVFSEVLADIEKKAALKSRSTRNSLQEYGYWAGVATIANDLIRLPEGVSRQIELMRRGGNDEKQRSTRA